MKKLILILCVVSLGLIGCQTEVSSPAPDATAGTKPITTQSPSPVVVAPAKLPDSSFKGWSPLYSDYIKSTIQYIHEFESADLSSYCSLKSAAKSDVWASILKWTAYYESSFNPRTTYTETTMGTDHVTGKQIVSEGLFQISYGSMKGYPNCRADYSKRNIQDPEVNLHCALMVMAKLLHKYPGKAEVALGKYWSVHRPHRKLPQVIEKVKKEIPGC